LEEIIRKLFSFSVSNTKGTPFEAEAKKINGKEGKETGDQRKDKQTGWIGKAI
jgi:hypothetical protein